MVTAVSGRSTVFVYVNAVRGNAAAGGTTLRAPLAFLSLSFSRLMTSTPARASARRVHTQRGTGWTGQGRTEWLSSRKNCSFGLTIFIVGLHGGLTVVSSHNVHVTIYEILRTYQYYYNNRCTNNVIKYYKLYLPIVKFHTV